MAVCIAMPPSRLLTAIGALPIADAVQVVAISGSDVAPARIIATTTARASCLRSAIASAWIASRRPAYQTAPAPARKSPRLSQIG